MTNQALRILHTESSCGWGGQEIRILNEMEGLKQRGHQVALLCPPEAEIHTAALARKITTYALPITYKTFAALIALRTWWGGNAQFFDVVNTHSSTDSWLVALTNLTQATRLPIVRTRHVSTSVNRSFFTRWLYQNATDYIVTTGEAIRQQLYQNNGFDMHRMCSVPTGVCFDTFSPHPSCKMREKLDLPRQAFLFGIVATLRSWKGHHYLLEAFHQLQHEWPDAKIVIVGDGPYKDHIQQQVNQLCLTGAVHFVGRQENVADWLNALDLFCLPSYGEEGVPQALMQAMACGVPVISTSVGAISEAVINEKTGLIVEPKNTQQLAQAMLRLYKAPDLRQQFGQAAIEHIQKNFSLGHMLDQMEVVFHTIVSNKLR